MNDKPTTDQSKSLLAHDERFRKLERELLKTKVFLILAFVVLAIIVKNL